MKGGSDPLQAEDILKKMQSWRCNKIGHIKEKAPND